MAKSIAQRIRNKSQDNQPRRHITKHRNAVKKHQNDNMIDSTESISTAISVWIATATLHKENKYIIAFTAKEIYTKMQEQKLHSSQYNTIIAHISSLCVANLKYSGGRHKKLYRVDRNRYRLYCKGDSYHPDRKNGKEAPLPAELPDKYRGLLDWYYQEYCPHIANTK